MARPGLPCPMSVVARRAPIDSLGALGPPPALGGPGNVPAQWLRAPTDAPASLPSSLRPWASGAVPASAQVVLDGVGVALGRVVGIAAGVAQRAALALQ